MAKKSPLAKALASKIGRWCYFKHPDTGAIVQGTYRRGRKIVVLEGIARPKAETPPGASRTYMFSERIYTVPKSIEITFGQPPAEAAAP
jgi:hypothetical protein